VLEKDNQKDKDKKKENDEAELPGSFGRRHLRSVVRCGESSCYKQDGPTGHGVADQRYQYNSKRKRNRNRKRKR
jgi:hypothetical protein